MKYITGKIRNEDIFTPSIKVNMDEEQNESKSFCGGLTCLLIKIFIVAYTSVCIIKISSI